MKITTTADGNRRCGGCTACCKLLPVVALDKGAGVRCQHQRHGKGCTIYARRPHECRLWSCRWLTNAEETHGMRRPDRAHYVIDALPDTVRLTNNETGEQTDLDALQIWIDPAFPETAQDPELRAYMLKMAEQHGMPSLLRWSNRIATAIFPPPINTAGEWHEVTSECSVGVGRYSRLPVATTSPSPIGL
jgi:hypothetical protein